MTKELKLGLQNGAQGILTTQSEHPNILAKVKQRVIFTKSQATQKEI